MSPSESSPHSSDHAPQAVVAIGGSAGALEALLAVLNALPANLGLAFVYVTHLPADSPSQTSQVLSRTTPMTVETIATGMPVKADHVYVVGPGCSIALEGGIFKVGPPWPAQHQIDRCFEALVAEYSSRCIGVLLSGMNDDGTLGLEAIKLAGGITFVQDGSAQSPRMPSAAIEAGCADAMLSPTEMARELAQLARHPWLDPVRSEEVSEQLEPVIEVLRECAGVDFSEYRATMLQRRILRRMALSKHVHFRQYAAALRDNEREMESLAQDILIGVTRFFRDPNAFQALAEKALPQVMHGRSANETRRVWILGCSTGEEAYSVAMLLEESARGQYYEIFATDLNAAAIEHARRGLYPRSIEETVSPARLRRFFDKVPQGYRITKSVRERCIFSVHNALSETSFANVDLLCCRNVLIYLSAVSQQKLIATLYRSLRPQGVLFLGVAESLIGRELFTPIDARCRIFSKRPNAIPHLPTTNTPTTSITIPPSTRTALVATSEDIQTKALREGERQLLNRYVPPGVFVDSKYEILHYRGDTNPYLTNYAGPPNTNLLRMCREGMLVPLRACLQQAKRSSSAVTTPHVKVYADDRRNEIVIPVIPVEVAEHQQRFRFYWVMFEPVLAVAAPAKERSRRKPARGVDFPQLVETLQERVVRQSAEIHSLREEMQQLQKHHLAAQEELRAAIEELTATNEGLIEKNAELVSTQLDLQSANEEQTLLIGEQRARNINLDELNDELSTLVTNLRLPIFMVWADLKIRRLTPTAARLIGASEEDINRPISDFRSPLQQLELAQLLTDSIESGRSQEVKALDVEGRWRLLCVNLYHRDGRVWGAVAVLVDIEISKDNTA